MCSSAGCRLQPYQVTSAKRVDSRDTSRLVAEEKPRAIAAFCISFNEIGSAGSAINDQKHGSQNIQSSRTGQGAKGRKKTTTVSCPVTWIGAKGARFRTGYRDSA